jgi:hypothetical protein
MKPQNSLLFAILQDLTPIHDPYSHDPYSQGFDNGWLENSACLGVKNIGKPCAVAPHARFDEEGLVRLTMEWLLRHRHTKEAETDRLLLMMIETNSLLYHLYCILVIIDAKKTRKLLKRLGF